MLEQVAAVWSLPWPALVASAEAGVWLSAAGIVFADTSPARVAGVAATVFTGQGRDGPVDMVLSTVSRRKAEQVLAAARSVADDAFASFDPNPRPVLQSTAGRV